MGMFDNISVAEKLPYSDEMKEINLDTNNLTFQTKDLDCLMDSYVIQNNKLYIQKYKTERWVDGDKNAKSLFDRLGHLEREEPYYEEINYHGEINFYDYTNNVKGKWDCWVEYRAIFTQGNLDKIELVKFVKTDNTERLQSEKEFKEKQEKEAAKWVNRYFLYTKPVCFLRRKISRVFYSLGNFFSNLSFKV